MKARVMSSMTLTIRSRALPWALLLALTACDSSTAARADAGLDLGGRADMGDGERDGGDAEGPDGAEDGGGADANDNADAQTGGEGGAGGAADAGLEAPEIARTNPVDGESGVALNRAVLVTFSTAMDPATINEMSFTLTRDNAPVAARITVSGVGARLAPIEELRADTVYSAKVGEDVRSLAGVPLQSGKAWTFTTGDTIAAGPAPVHLGTAVGFVALAKSGIDTIPASVITGDIGVSPIDSTALTGFSLTVDPSGEFATSDQLIGRAYAADYIVPTPSKLTTAIRDLEGAYADAAGRAIPDFVELGAGDISGLTLTPGLYKWGTGVLISTDVTLDGGADDVWIFQIAGGITQAAGSRVLLSGGARPQNIFWQAFGGVTLDTDSHFEGIVLAQTHIALATGASLNGRVLSQTAITLDSSRLTEPDE